MTRLLAEMRVWALEVVMFQIRNEPHDYSIESSMLLHDKPRHFKGESAWPNIDNLANRCLARAKLHLAMVRLVIFPSTTKRRSPCNITKVSKFPIEKGNDYV